MDIKEFHDKKTGTLSYIVYDLDTLDSIIIDPVLNFDPELNQTSTQSMDQLVQFVKTNQLNVHYILETHVHADHLSCSQNLKTIFSQAKLAINENISAVQKLFKDELELGENFNTGGEQFDLLLSDGQEFAAGSLKVKVLFTPGHTPACTSFVIGENIFTGDALFMPDLGTGRCDFPGGSAHQLFDSIKNKIYQLPDHYKMFSGHDYPPKSRKLQSYCTLKDQKLNNKHLTINTPEEEFIKFRTDRDKTLNPPKLITPSLKVNLNAGHISYL